MRDSYSLNYEVFCVCNVTLFRLVQR